MAIRSCSGSYLTFHILTPMTTRLWDRDMDVTDSSPDFQLCH